MTQETPEEDSAVDQRGVAAGVVATFASTMLAGIVALVAFAFVSEGLSDRYFLPVGLPIVLICTLGTLFGVRYFLLRATDSRSDDS